MLESLLRQNFHNSDQSIPLCIIESKIHVYRLQMRKFVQGLSKLNEALITYIIFIEVDAE